MDTRGTTSGHLLSCKTCLSSCYTSTFFNTVSSLVITHPPPRMSATTHRGQQIEAIMSENNELLDFGTASTEQQVQYGYQDMERIPLGPLQHQESGLHESSVPLGSGFQEAQEASSPQHRYPPVPQLEPLPPTALPGFQVGANSLNVLNAQNIASSSVLSLLPPKQFSCVVMPAEKVFATSAVPGGHSVLLRRRGKTGIDKPLVENKRSTSG